jgi:hypothetical protein
MSFARPDASLNYSRRVNSGVRRLRPQTEVMLSDRADQKHHQRWMLTSQLPPNNSLDPTGISVPLIENLMAARQCFPAGQFGR